MAFLPYQREVEGEGPRTSTANAYPYAAERILSLFADPPAAPTWPSSTPRHYFPDEGGHHGEHGSLDVVQSRAPLVLAGAGVARRGYLDDHAHLVDVGPTLAALAGVPRRPARRGGRAARRTGPRRVLDPAVTPPRRRRHPLGRRAPQRPAAPGRSRAPAGGGSPHRAGPGAARRGGRAVPERHADQPHLDPHRHRTRPARGAGQRVLRPRPISGSYRTTRRPGTGRRSGFAPGCARSSRWSRITLPSKGSRVRSASTRPSTRVPTTRRCR